MRKGNVVAWTETEIQLCHLTMSVVSSLVHSSDLTTLLAFPPFSASRFRSFEVLGKQISSFSAHISTFRFLFALQYNVQLE